MNQADTLPLYAFMGATASGKSSLALDFARKHHGAIISADSMQIYRDLPIGTAQPTPEEQQEIPHYLVAECDLQESFTVFEFIKRAENAIADARAKGFTPILCGGTGFYLKALFYGLDDLPGDAELRAELDQQYDRDDAFDALRERMRILDPAALDKWHDCRRKLIRSLEVKLLTGKSITELQTHSQQQLRFPVTAYVVSREPEVLRERIATRTHEMLKAGWVEEAEKALQKGLLQTPTAHQALGYRIIADHLSGKISHQEMADKIIIATGQYARRQRTWFRHQHPEAEVLPL
jgi:tRNA dimethylallyltransferase